jgi:hypothetical protein
MGNDYVDFPRLLLRDLDVAYSKKKSMPTVKYDGEKFNFLLKFETEEDACKFAEILNEIHKSRKEAMDMIE